MVEIVDTRPNFQVLQGNREKLDRVDDAFVHERSIDAASYERQRDKLREEITLTEWELGEARTDQFDVKGILAFAQHVLTNAARLWNELDLDPKQRLQQAPFPEGLEFDGQEFRTVVTCLAFKRLPDDESTKSEMASAMEFDPVEQARKNADEQEVHPIAPARAT